MKKIILYTISILTATLWAVTNEYNCNTPNTPNMNPDGSCQQFGYICNLGFNVYGENNIMYFQLGADSTCSTLLTSSIKTYKHELDSSYSDYPKFFLIENENKMGPLSLTLAGSLAMMAASNNIPVDIIYKKVGEYDFGGIKLLSITLINH